MGGVVKRAASRCTTPDARERVPDNPKISGTLASVAREIFELVKDQEFQTLIGLWMLRGRSSDQ
jgi:hypothetical protein